MSRKKDWDEEIQPPPYCSSDDFVRALQQGHPQLLVPEHAIVYVGESIPMWGPGREAPVDPDLPCPACGDELERGTLLCCPRCHASGFDGKLAQQRGLAGYPAPEPPAPKPTPSRARRGLVVSKPETRRERRRRQFACPTTAPSKA